jgi:hypothetical protein
MSGLIYNDNSPSEFTFKEPVSFINSIDKSKHLVLYYDKLKFGKSILFEFIKKGLLNNENCIYSISCYENSSLIENEMNSYGIDTQYYIKNGLLTIFKIPDLMSHPKGFIDGSKEILNKMFLNINPKKPFRLIARFIDKLNSKEQIEANMILEKYYHQRFFTFNGCVLCHYDVGNGPIADNTDWLKSILQSHHSAIFITDADGKGIAFDI